MKVNRAIDIAVTAIELQIKHLAVNANLEDVYHAGLPTTIRASKDRKILLDAIKTLREMTHENSTR